MAVYIVQGKLGVGKTKFAVWMAQFAIRDGLRVASNVDLFMDKLTPERRAHYIRIPDKPDEFSLNAMGHGNPDSYDEDRNGILILDELGTWLNSRAFQDKSRAGVIDWLIHARKLGWHVYLVVQDAGMIDKQVREALVEYEVRVMRMDKVRYPFVGKFIGWVGGLLGYRRWGYFPRFHMATARVGYGANQIVAEKWMYRGDDLHAAYDTRQRFSSDYPHGAHSALAPWDYAPPVSWSARNAQRLRDWRASVLGPRTRSARALAPKHRLVASIERALPPDERARHVARLVRLGLIA